MLEMGIDIAAAEARAKRPKGRKMCSQNRRAIEGGLICHKRAMRVSKSADFSTSQSCCEHVHPGSNSDHDQIGSNHTKQLHNNQLVLNKMRKARLCEDGTCHQRIYIIKDTYQILEL